MKRLKKYVSAGISTDHECSTLKEAVEKISLGMKILIREGSAAKNLNSLKELFNSYPDMVMLCSDDLHPEMLRKRHINKLIGSLITEGYDIFNVIRSATLNPSEHYGLKSGLLREGEDADFIIVDKPEEMNVKETWIKGKCVFSGGKALFEYSGGRAINNFNSGNIAENDIRIENRGGEVRVIEAVEGELLTGQSLCSFGTAEIVSPDTEKDILKIVVKDRYKNSPPVVGFIRGFGLKKGAFASSIAHDSHNIIAVGTNDSDIVKSINEIVRHKGGLAVSTGESISSIGLNIGGIMTSRSCEEIADDYEKLNVLVGSMGCTMKSPFHDSFLYGSSRYSRSKDWRQGII